MEFDYETVPLTEGFAESIRSGLFERAEVVEYRGLHAVVGTCGDGSPSAPEAKYADRRRAN